MDRPIENAPPLLNSWKQIASYLHCGVRTAQRWERERQLPVHRVGKGRRAPVFAFGEEIHGWAEHLPRHNPASPEAPGKKSA